jgi:hypothetical protein
MKAAVRARPTMTAAMSSGRMREGKACLVTPHWSRQSDNTAENNTDWISDRL